MNKSFPPKDFDEINLYFQNLGTKKIGDPKFPATHSLRFEIEKLEAELRDLNSKWEQHQAQQQENKDSQSAEKKSYRILLDLILQIQDTQQVSDFYDTLSRFLVRYFGSKPVILCFTHWPLTQSGKVFLPKSLVPDHAPTPSLPNDLPPYQFDDIYLYDPRVPCWLKKWGYPVTQERFHVLPLNPNSEDNILLLLDHQTPVDQNFDLFLNIQAILKVHLTTLLASQKSKTYLNTWLQVFNPLEMGLAILNQDHEVLACNTQYPSELHKDLIMILKKEAPLPAHTRTFEMATPTALWKIDSSTLQTYDQDRLILLTLENIRQDRQMFNQFIQQQKMERIEKLGSRLAHDLLNPLGGVKSMSQLLQAQGQEEVVPSQVLLDLAEVEKSCDRSIQIIRALQNFARSKNQLTLSELSAFSLRHEISQALIFAKSMTRYIRLHTQFDQDQDTVGGDPFLFQQIMVNLIQNAYHAMGDKGGQIWIHTQALEDGRWEVYFQDSGPGIPLTLRHQIFEPLFSTKAPGQGTGLGLSFIKQVLQNWGASIELESPRFGQVGAAFKMILNPKG